MKLEEITPENLRKVDDKEILQVWHRLNQWFASAIERGEAIETIVDAA